MGAHPPLEIAARHARCVGVAGLDGDDRPFGQGKCGERVIVHPLAVHPGGDIGCRQHRFRSPEQHLRRIESVQAKVPQRAAAGNRGVEHPRHPIRAIAIRRTVDNAEMRVHGRAGAPLGAQPGQFTP